MHERFRRVPAASRAFWWKVQFRGIVNFHAPFLGCNKLILRDLGVIANSGARRVGNLPHRHNVDLHSIKFVFNICVQTFYARCVVKYVGHTFRHPDHQLSQLLSLPLPSRLALLRRSDRGGAASDSAQTTYNFLRHLGISMQPLVTGPLGVRGNSGFVCRWGEGWFWEIRDGGPGWKFDKFDTSSIEHRTDLLLTLFRKRQSPLPSILQDSPPLALDNG